MSVELQYRRPGGARRIDEGVEMLSQLGQASPRLAGCHSIESAAASRALGDPLQGSSGADIEVDEIYVVSGWKDRPAGIGPPRPPRSRRLKGQRGRGNWESDKVHWWLSCSGMDKYGSFHNAICRSGRSTPC